MRRLDEGALEARFSGVVLMAMALENKVGCTFVKVEKRSGAFGK